MKQIFFQSRRGSQVQPGNSLRACLSLPKIYAIVEVRAAVYETVYFPVYQITGFWDFRNPLEEEILSWH